MKRAPISIHPLALIVGVYLTLGLVYSATIPLFEAPDEQWHFAYVQYVATGHGLPVQSLDHPTHLARQEGSQPPLFYLVAAGATAWINTSDFPGIIWENPHYGYNVPGIVNDNKNLFIHTAIENFPYQGASLAIHLARLVSLLFGALAVCFTYRLTKEIFPKLTYLALCSAALVAFVPQFLLVSSAVSNDSAIVAMSGLSLWLIIRSLRREPQLRDIVGIGAATGLAALAKLSGVGLILLALFVLTYVLRKNLRQMGLSLMALISTFGLVAGWWYLRNWFLYGEATGTETMLHIFGARQTPLTVAQFFTQLGEVWETFWIGFGWGNIRAQPVVYNALEILTLASVIGLVVGILRRRQQLPATSTTTMSLGVLTIWAAEVFFEFLRWMMLTQAPHGRLLFPALPALTPLFGLGLTWLTPHRFHRLSAPAFSTALFGLAALSPPLIIAPAYAFPPELTAADVQNLAHRVDIDYGDKIKLLGFDLSPSPVQPGEAIQLDLYWQSLATMDRDYSIGIHLLDPSLRVIGARDSYPGHGLFPTSLWHVGEIIRDDYWVPVAAEAPAPSVAQIQIALYDRADQTDLTAFDPRGQSITPFVGRFKIASAISSPARAENPTNYTFGNEISLTGYDLRADTSISLTIYWARVKPVPVDYTVFVHVLDADGRIVAQKDQQPVGGANPTSLWGEGERVIDPYTLEAPRTAAQIELGLYQADTGVRLSVVDSEGHSLGDHVMLSMPK